MDSPDLYCDLKLIIKKGERSAVYYVDKTTLLPQSQMLSMLIKRANDNVWPPVNELTLTLPDSLGFKSFIETIRYLSGAVETINDLNPFIRTLIYLMDDEDFIINMGKEYFPKDRFLNERETDLLIHLHDNFGDKVSALIELYYYDIIKTGVKPFLEKDYFGKAIDDNGSWYTFPPLPP
jgi:hypothetical protein